MMKTVLIFIFTLVFLDNYITGQNNSSFIYYKGIRYNIHINFCNLTSCNNCKRINCILSFNMENLDKYTLYFLVVAIITCLWLQLWIFLNTEITCKTMYDV